VFKDPQHPQLRVVVGLARGRKRVGFFENVLKCPQGKSNEINQIKIYSLT